MMKKLISVLAALVVLLSLAVPALAADSVVDYSGHGIFDFAPGSAWTDTDLFDGFKDVMPGDVLTEVVTVKNTARCCDYIRMYLQAVPHVDATNPLSATVAAEETIESMEDFLAMLTLTVRQGNTVIYTGPANQMDEMNAFDLGWLSRGKSKTLNLTLEVPIDMDNTYAFRVGEIDWKFTIREYDNDSDIPKTGDHMSKLLLPCVLAMSISAGGLILLLMYVRKRRKS